LRPRAQREQRQIEASKKRSGAVSRRRREEFRWWAHKGSNLGSADQEFSGNKIAARRQTPPAGAYPLLFACVFTAAFSSGRDRQTTVFQVRADQESEGGPAAGGRPPSGQGERGNTSRPAWLERRNESIAPEYVEI
jgi:hypothetical protein